MYQPMLYVHWKQVRLALIPFVVASFGLPLLVVQGLGPTSAGDTVALDAYRIMAEYAIWLPLFPLLAFAIGITLALSAWNWDHELNHVYALSLPLARWEYAMLKMGAGALLGLIPVAALWIGAHLASASVSLPEGLHAYPNQLTFRFFLAILLSYSLFFAMAAGTIKTTIWVGTAVVVYFIAGSVINDALGFYFEYFQDVNIVESTLTWLVQAPGPFEVFAGNWSLIDV